MTTSKKTSKSHKERDNSADLPGTLARTDGHEMGPLRTKREVINTHTHEKKELWPLKALDRTRVRDTRVPRGKIPVAAAPAPYPQRLQSLWRPWVGSDEQDRQKRQQPQTNSLQATVILTPSMWFKCQVGCQKNQRGRYTLKWSACKKMNSQDCKIESQVDHPLNYLSRMLMDYFSCTFYEVPPAFLCWPMLSRSQQSRWADGPSSRQEPFPQHFPTHRSWHHLSLLLHLPTRTAAPRRRAAMWQHTSYRTTLPASHFTRIRVPSAF